MNRDLLRTLVLATAVALSGAAVAQDGSPSPSSILPPAVTWEPFGLEAFTVYNIVFAEGPAPDGSLDTLYAVDNDNQRFGEPEPDPERGGDGPHRLPPGGEWSGNLCDLRSQGFNCSPRLITRTSSGVLLVGNGSGTTRVNRSTDGAVTWEHDVHDEHVNCLYAASADFDHAVFACERNGPIWRSDADGVTGSWETLGFLVPGDRGFHAFSLTEALPGPSIDRPRLVAAALGGIAYSDDGGTTWALSSMWQNFRWRVNGGIARVPVADHPYGGVFYAAVRDHYTFPGVYASEDGGETWESRSSGPDMTEFRFTRGVVATDTSGGVWYGTSVGSWFSGDSRGSVLWSGDGARTWADVSEGLPGIGVNALLFGRDGRLYAGTDEGVWRTTEPVVVSSSAGPAEPADLGVRVDPNPSSGSAAARWRQVQAGEARVSVFDARGREVLLLTDGAVRAGENAAEIDTSALSPGVYVVRVATEAGAASARFTVAR